MTTQIDRIINSIIKNTTLYESDKDTIRQILEAEPTVNGVDELVEKYSKSQGIVNVRELISDLKSLKQTAVTSQKELDDRDNDLANIFNTAKQTGTKGDLFINIMDYLVSKGFLQKGVATEERLNDSQLKEVEIDYRRFGKMTRYILTIPMGKTYGYAMPDYVLKIEKVPYDKGERPQIFVDEWIA